MYFDAFTISALVDEFMDTFVGGRIQDVIDTDETGLGWEIYANRQRQYLYISADHLMPRIHIVSTKLRRGLPKPTQLGLLMRKKVEGGVITHVSQPAWERIIQMDVEGPEGDVTVIVELMERRSNIILVQDGMILDSIRRVGSEQNRYRLILPRHEYVPPPPLTGRLNPFAITRDDLQGIFDQNKDPKQKVFRLLASRILGFSPLLAKEVLHRAFGTSNLRVDDIDIEKLLEPIQELMEPLAKREWQPGFVQAEDGTKAFSAYPLQSISNWSPTETISEAIENYYGVLVGADAYIEAKKPVQAAIDEAKAKLSAKLASLERSMTDDRDRDLLKQSGELILAHQYAMEDGQAELVAQYDYDAPAITIRLDPTLSPLENAQKYFNKYNRYKRALNEVPQLIDETKHNLAYIHQLESDLVLASNWNDIDDVMQGLQSRGYLPKAIKRVGGGGKSAPLRFTIDGYVIWVGRNSRQNEQVTFKNANPQDLWLHARDVPGAHVIIRNDGRRIPQALIEKVASVAGYYSLKRNEAKVDVDVTRCKYVKKIKGAGPGMVTYRNEETLIVQPYSEAILEND